MSQQNPTIPSHTKNENSLAEKRSKYANKIGPNSIIRTVEALKETYGIPKTNEILEKVGKSIFISSLPSEMIDEEEFHSLAVGLHNFLGTEQANKILKRSGQLTAGYLLQNRIPKPAQRILGILPRSIGLKMLLTAIGKNAWTFVGSGNYTFVVGKTPQITIHNCLACRGVQSDIPVCSFYASTFETLLQSIIGKNIMVNEATCIAQGNPCCSFPIQM